MKSQCFDRAKTNQLICSAYNMNKKYQFYFELIKESSLLLKAERTLLCTGLPPYQYLVLRAHRNKIPQENWKTLGNT